MMNFLNKYKLYRDADRRWHLNELDKQLDVISLSLCEKFKDGNSCSLGCPLLVEGNCAKEVIKEYTEHERNDINAYYGI